MAREVAGPAERGPGSEVRLGDPPHLRTRHADDEFVERVAVPKLGENGLDGGQARGLQCGQVGVARSPEVGGLLHRKHRDGLAAAHYALAGDEGKNGFRAVVGADGGEDMHGTGGLDGSGDKQANRNGKIPKAMPSYNRLEEGMGEWGRGREIRAAGGRPRHCVGAPILPFPHALSPNHP